MDIPNILLDQIREGQVILFLGSGASVGALHKDHKQVPVGQQLADLISEKFLGPKFHNHPLAQVAELAISETDLFSVQEFIATLFQDFYPNTFHKLIPRFVWKAIATTNYDLIVERAYDAVTDRMQRPVVFKKNGERVEQKLSGGADVLVMKLHGSITDTNDPDIPLILTPDQYVLYKKNRSRLFERLTGLSHEFPLVFVGHSISDLNLRAMLLELSELGHAKPRSYLVNPDITEQEVRYWEAKRITPIEASFKEFIECVDANIPVGFRALATTRTDADHPIFARFSSSRAKPSKSLLTLLDRDVDYLYPGVSTGDTSPKEFYKGYFPNWDPIEMGLDVRRGLSDAILSEIFLVTEEEKGDKQELAAILGHAGSGKTVILRRVAWDAAIEFKKLCLAVRPSARPEYEAVHELYNLSKERIFLFIDHATEYADLIQEFLTKARRDRLPITIITPERPNEWNAYCENLNPYVTHRYEVGYLNSMEIEQLIMLLAKHRSLGYLEDKTFEEQKEALATRAGRQILVALHEATLGKPFKDIVFNEYNSIPSTAAKLLYISVCILHRLGVVTRAGVISRVHSIPFTLFREKLFKPLEFILFATENKLIGDFEYRTRHSHIAEMVFETVLVDQQERYDEYIRILGALDVDYNSDRDAFKGMVNARELRRLFSDPDMVRSIYRVAKERSSTDPMLLQQEAIFEMSFPEGDLQKATELLVEAKNLAPWYPPIAHSLSVLSLRKSEKASSDLERTKYRNESRDLALAIASKNKDDPHAYHTLIKIGLSELEDLIAEGVESSIEVKIKQIQKNISSALQSFPEESFILEADSRFNKLINDNPKALESLRKAFLKNKRTPYIALRLADMLKHKGEQVEAIGVLRDAVEGNPSDKDLNFNLGLMLQSLPDEKPAEIKHHLRNSFTAGDTRYIAQFWYARFLYIEGNIADAKELFKSLGESNVDIEIKNKERGKIYRSGVPLRFSGTIRTVEASYGFLTRDQLSDDIFIYRFNEDQDLWDSLTRGKRVSFEMAFNYRGPIARSLEDES